MIDSRITGQVAFLTMNDLSDFVSDDELTISPLNDAGIAVAMVDWQDKSVDWNEFDVVIVRSTWNYQQHAEPFLSVLNEIESSSAKLLNPLAAMRWNVDKSYLRELPRLGLPTIPTQWFEGFDKAKLDAAIELIESDTFVLKPTISANADNTFRIAKSDWIDFDNAFDLLPDIFAVRSIMLQPFVSSILNRGEFSLFYIDGAFTHAVVKNPKSGDFRVQEEHGGVIHPCEPDLKLKQFGDKIASHLPWELLYARFDCVEFDGEWVVMEIELIEPSLYFRFSEQAVSGFARAIEFSLNESTNTDA